MLIFLKQGNQLIVLAGIRFIICGCGISYELVLVILLNIKICSCLFITAVKE